VAEPRLSVIIAAHNEAENLPTQLDALVGQAPDVPWEVLVVDNRSTDRTVAVAESYRGRLDLRVVPAHDRPGGGYARNVGAAATTAPLLGFVDADDKVAPGWVEAMVRALEEHQFVAGPFDAEELNDPSVQRSRWLPQTDGLQTSTVGPGLPFAGGGNLGIHRSVYEAVGGFDEDVVGFPDTDFCWRVQLAGVPLVFAPDALLHVRLRSSIRDMWRQGRSYGAAQTVMDQRYGSIPPEAVPAAVRAAADPAPGSRVPVSRARGRWMALVYLARDARHPAAFVWKLGWHVGRLGWPRTSRGGGAPAPADAQG
jgi:GT2 family glycosyltransferase